MRTVDYVCLHFTFKRILGLVNQLTVCTHECSKNIVMSQYALLNILVVISKEFYQVSSAWKAYKLHR